MKCSCRAVMVFHRAEVDHALLAIKQAKNFLSTLASPVSSKHLSRPQTAHPGVLQTSNFCVLSSDKT